MAGYDTPYLQNPDKHSGYSKKSRNITQSFRKISWGGAELDVSDTILAATEDPDLPERPEINLRIALLKDSIYLLMKPKPREDEKADLEYTKRWLNGEYESYPGYSFAEISQALGYDPDYLRSGILDFVASSRTRKDLRYLFVRNTSQKVNGVKAPRRRCKKRKKPVSQSSLNLAA